MSTQSKHEYLTAIRDRYHRVGRRFKSKILDEFCAVCGYARKYAIRLLARNARPARRRPGPKPKYDARLRAILKTIWLATDQLCSKRLQPALRLWLPYYEQLHGPLPRRLRRKLGSISPATIDRLLRPLRARYRGKGLSGSRPNRWLRQHIPIRTRADDITQPGFLEVDAVAHCGASLAGDFIWSLNFTDFFSAWTETRATWNKSRHQVLTQVRHVEDHLPFPLRGFDIDNGAEFLNHHLYRYLTRRARPVAVTRSRPYHKDDQAHVEQKNYTHVRLLLGYQRLEDPDLVALINDLYAHAWCPWQNFFLPSMKLRGKIQIGSKYRRDYGTPQTAYQRLMRCRSLSAAAKRELRRRFESLNPFELKNAIEEKLKMIFDRASKAAKSVARV
jgi:hypothetical protein